jgi:hypothetical protein
MRTLRTGSLYEGAVVRFWDHFCASKAIGPVVNHWGDWREKSLGSQFCAADPLRKDGHTIHYP